MGFRIDGVFLDIEACSLALKDESNTTLQIVLHVINGTVAQAEHLFQSKLDSGLFNVVIS